MLDMVSNVHKWLSTSVYEVQYLSDNVYEEFY